MNIIYKKAHLLEREHLHQDMDWYVEKYFK